MTADLASDLGLELSVEQVDNDGLVASAVVLLGLLGHHNVRTAVAVLKLDILLVSHAVQVLVKTVQQEGKQFLKQKNPFQNEKCLIFTVRILTFSVSNRKT